MSYSKIAPYNISGTISVVKPADPDARMMKRRCPNDDILSKLMGLNLKLS